MLGYGQRVDAAMSAMPSFSGGKRTIWVSKLGAGRKVEVLGNKVRCDVRYTELKIPERNIGRSSTNAWANTGSTKKEVMKEKVHAHNPPRCNHVYCFVLIDHRGACRRNVVRQL
jgi:hypothetical protein